MCHAMFVKVSDLEPVDDVVETRHGRRPGEVSPTESDRGIEHGEAPRERLDGGRHFEVAHAA